MAASRVAGRPDAEDGRVRRVRATAKGRRVLEAGRARRVASLAALLAALGPAELAALERSAQLIERLIRR